MKISARNILKGTIVDPEKGRIAIDGQEVFASRGGREGQAGEVHLVALRPEAILLDEGGADRNRMDGTIEEVSFLGSVVRIRVRFRDNVISLDTFNNPSAPPPVRGQKVTVTFAHEDLLVLESAEAA